MSSGIGTKIDSTLKAKIVDSEGGNPQYKSLYQMMQIQPPKVGVDLLLKRNIITLLLKMHTRRLFL